MRRRVLHTIFFICAFLLGGGLFALLVWRTGPAAIGNSLVAFGILPFLGFVAISLLNFTLYSLRWQTIVNDMVAPEMRLSLRSVFLHRMSGYAAGYLTPASQVAGEPIRVAMLRSEGIPLKEATGAVVLDLAFEIAAFVVFVVSGIVLATASGLGDGAFVGGAAGFTGALVVLLIVFFWMTANGTGFVSGLFRALRLHKVTRFRGAYQWMEEMEKLMTKFFSGKPVLLVGVVLLSLIMISFKVIETVFIAWFFGVHLVLRDAFLLATLPGVVLLLPVPGGIGVYEGTNAATFALLGVPLNPVAFTMIIRLRDFIFIAIGVTHALQRGEKLVGKSK